MSITQHLNLLEDTKAGIKKAIQDKGVPVNISDPFSSYPDKIRQIESGGGGDYVKVNFKDFVSGENYKDYKDNFTVVLPDNVNTIQINNALIWEWNNIIYIGLGQIASTQYGNNKVYKYDKNTLKYIGQFTAGTVGFVSTFSNVYVYNNKAFFTTGNTYTLSATTATINANLRIIDLVTETMTNGVAVPNINTYVSIFTKNWCFQIDNTGSGTAANSVGYLIDLDTPSTRYTISSLGQNGAKSIEWQDDNVYWAGGGSAGVTSVVKLNLITRTQTVLPAMPRVQNYLRSFSNERYIWFTDGWQTGGNSRELIQYNIATNEQKIINLDYDILEPLARLNTPQHCRIKQNLYIRAIGTTYMNSFLSIDTTEDDWYVDRKGFSYISFIFGRFQSANGTSIFSNGWLSDDGIAYSSWTGSGTTTSYTTGAGALFSVNDTNKYITINTPIGSLISIDGGAEQLVINPITQVKSPFNGYIKYKSGVFEMTTLSDNDTLTMEDTNNLTQEQMILREVK